MAGTADAKPRLKFRHGGVGFVLRYPDGSEKPVPYEKVPQAAKDKLPQGERDKLEASLRHRANEISGGSSNAVISPIDKFLKPAAKAKALATKRAARGGSSSSIGSKREFDDVDKTPRKKIKVE